MKGPSTARDFYAAGQIHDPFGYSKLSKVLGQPGRVYPRPELGYIQTPHSDIAGTVQSRVRARESSIRSYVGCLLTYESGLQGKIGRRVGWLKTERQVVYTDVQIGQ